MTSSSTKSKRNIWVIKIGSQLISDHGKKLLLPLMQESVELMRLHSVSIVWVTSGAIATARKHLNFNWESLPEKQAMSAFGQPILMNLYADVLKKCQAQGAQVLLSYSDFKRKESRINLKNTLHKLLDWGIIPILNENDVVATDEIQFGDNDQLSAMVACELSALRLIILTNVHGLYDGDPEDRHSRLISHLQNVPQGLIRKVVANKISAVGSGGMASKLLAAKRVNRKGILATIVSGNQKSVLKKIYKGEMLGTTIGKKDGTPSKKTQGTSRTKTALKKSTSRRKKPYS